MLLSTDGSITLINTLMYMDGTYGWQGLIHRDLQGLGASRICIDVH